MEQGTAARNKERQKLHVINLPQPHFLSLCAAEGDRELEIKLRWEEGKTWESYS